jgi:hypothetical protein
MGARSFKRSMQGLILFPATYPNSARILLLVMPMVSGPPQRPGWAGGNRPVWKRTMTIGMAITVLIRTSFGE